MPSLISFKNMGTKKFRRFHSYLFGLSRSHLNIITILEFTSLATFYNSLNSVGSLKTASRLSD